MKFLWLTCFLLLLSQLAGLAQDQDGMFYKHWHLLASDQRGLPRSDTYWGSGVATLGDLDGDGVPELAVSQSNAKDRPGQLWIVSLDSTGTIQGTKRITRPSNLPRYYTWEGNWGQRLQALGDWDGNGVPDVAVCEPDASLGGIPYGVVWLLLLQADGSLKEAVPLHPRVDGVQGVASDREQFGQDVAVIGDIDRNGQADLAVGASGSLNRDYGEVYVLLMKTAREVERTVALSKTLSGGWRNSMRKGDQFGYAVEAAGDLDGNGVMDLYVGAPGDDENGLNRGAVYTFWLKEDGSVRRDHKTISEKRDFNVVLDADDRWGGSIARLDGPNEEGLSTVVTSAYLDDDGFRNLGALYVLTMDEKAKVAAYHKVSFGTENFEGDVVGKEYRWGHSLNPAGDLDGDGHQDILVNGELEGRNQGSFWVLRPREWLDHKAEAYNYAPGAFQVSAEDSARIYVDAKTAADSARIDSLYDLSGYAPTHVVLLLDVSASMSQANRLPLLREAFINLLPFLRPEDKVSIITYSGSAHVQLSAVSAQERARIRETIETLESEGGTEPRKALEMAYELAEAEFISGGNNRVIFATDGGFDPDDLDRPLRKSASERIPVSVFYFGKMADYRIEEMEALARRGFGNAAHITSASVTEALLREIKVIRRKENPAPPTEE